jgi:hypothetical protein
MKVEVYSWRVTTELKSALEREGRARNVPVSSLLEMAVQDWLKRSSSDAAEEQDQPGLHATAERFIGAFAGRNPRRAETARQTIAQRLRRR